MEISEIAHGLWAKFCFHVANWCTTWDLVNIAIPIGLPILCMAILICFKSEDPRYKENGKLVVVIKDGQLGYIAVVMSLAMVYDFVGQTMNAERLFACIGGMVYALVGAVIAAAGAIYTTHLNVNDMKRWAKIKHFAPMYLSIVVVCFAALTFHHSHHYLLKPESCEKCKDSAKT